MARTPQDQADAERQGRRPAITHRKEAATMIDEIRQFVLDSLTDMNYSIEGVDEMM